MWFSILVLPLSTFIADKVFSYFTGSYIYTVYSTNADLVLTFHCPIFTHAFDDSNFMGGLSIILCFARCSYGALTSYTSAFRQKGEVAILQSWPKLLGHFIIFHKLSISRHLSPPPLENDGFQESRMCLKYSTGKGFQHCSGERGKNLSKAIAMIECKLLVYRSFHVKRRPQRQLSETVFGQGCSFGFCNT